MRWTYSISILFAFLSAFWLFAFASGNTNMTIPAMPLAEVARRTKMAELLDPVGVVCALIAGLIIYGYNRSRSLRYRVLFPLAGILFPLLVLGSNSLFFVIFVVVSPIQAFPILIQAFSGQGDGEFYNEGMLMWATIGLWIILCAILILREYARGFKESRLSVGGVPPSSKSPAQS
jgi:hypothetical protein